MRSAVFACMSVIVVLLTACRPDSAYAGTPKKILFLAGSTAFRPGEHEYAAGCSVLMKLVQQSPGIDSQMVIDWPVNANDLVDADCVVMFFDGSAKHQLVKQSHVEQLKKRIDAGVGLVALHQVVDIPKAEQSTILNAFGAVWEPGHSQRAHWVAVFDTFPEHPIMRGVTPFTIDDGWLYRLRLNKDRGEIVPLLMTTNPKEKSTGSLTPSSDAMVSWAYIRPDNGRSFAFTGGHLHASLAEPGYRRFLVNGILWAAGADVPAGGAPVKLSDEELKSSLEKPPRPGMK